MISLVTISCIAAAFAPVVSKRLQADTIRAGSTAKLESNCSDQFGEDCKFCGDKCCYICDSNASCADDEFKNTCKCACVKCNATKADGGYGEGCVECNSSGCTKCQDGNNGYYLKEDKTCAKCTQAGKTYSDGKNCVASCESVAAGGQYCDASGKLHFCADRYHPYCNSCTKDRCNSCGTFAYYLHSSGNCASCPSNCSNCSSCNGSSSCNVCRGGCRAWAYKESSSSTVCINCTTGKYAIPNCSYCNDDGSGCYLCASGYYITAAKKCAQCTQANCNQCKDGVNNFCLRCNGGYYVASNGSCQSCSSKYGSNCVTCNASKCLTCSKTYHVKNNPSSSNACESDEYNFYCSDSNFMQLGNLCVTRKNMGDSPVLKIPSSVTVVGAGETCLSQSQHEPCCWRGNNNDNVCTNNGKYYSGCNRTICNGHAAKLICESFNYQGLKWRLPTNDEASMFWSYTRGLGANGLGICNSSSSAYSEYCGSTSVNGNCTGAIHGCFPSFILTKEGSRWNPSGDFYGRDGYGQESTYSIRCVADMTEYLNTLK